MVNYFKFFRSRNFKKQDMINVFCQVFDFLSKLNKFINTEVR
jgi:hypothetical protein